MSLPLRASILRSSSLSMLLMSCFVICILLRFLLIRDARRLVRGRVRNRELWLARFVRVHLPIRWISVESEERDDPRDDRDGRAERGRQVESLHESVARDREQRDSERVRELSRDAECAAERAERGLSGFGRKPSWQSALECGAV